MAQLPDPELSEEMGQLPPWSSETVTEPVGVGPLPVTVTA
jgi:hypothetical protein